MENLPTPSDRRVILVAFGSIPYNADVAQVIDTLEFETVEGERHSPAVTVFALSTCAFCKRGMEFLEKHGFRYRYVYLDQLDPDMKRRLKQELKERFDVVPVFPILIIDEAKAFSGFTELIWTRALGIS